MANPKIFGLTLVELAPVAADGGVGTAFIPVGETVIGSASITSTDPTSTDFNIEESDSPVESIVSDPAKLSFSWSSYNVSADQLVELYGGIKTVGPPVSWEAPDALPDVVRSIRLTDKKGNVITIPRAKISTKLSLSFAKDKLGQLDMTATVLQPTKVGVKRLKIVYA